MEPEIKKARHDQPQGQINVENGNGESSTKKELADVNDHEVTFDESLICVESAEEKSYQYLFDNLTDFDTLLPESGVNCGKFIIVNSQFFGIGDRNNNKPFYDVIVMDSKKNMASITNWGDEVGSPGQVISIDNFLWKATPKCYQAATVPFQGSSGNEATWNIDQELSNALNALDRDFKNRLSTSREILENGYRCGYMKILDGSSLTSAKSVKYCKYQLKVEDGRLSGIAFNESNVAEFPKDYCFTNVMPNYDRLQNKITGIILTKHSKLEPIDIPVNDILTSDLEVLQLKQIELQNADSNKNYSVEMVAVAKTSKIKGNLETAVAGLTVDSLRLVLSSDIAFEKGDVIKGTVKVTGKKLFAIDLKKEKNDVSLLSQAHKKPFFK